MNNHLEQQVTMQATRLLLKRSVWKGECLKSLSAQSEQPTLADLTFLRAKPRAVSFQPASQTDDLMS